MKSPFKFLDPYTLEDKNSFFGREREEKTLFRLIKKTKLAIVYGLSGTGKTSLIQCGLARQFEGPDWLPVFIRRQNNINTSLDTAINKLLMAEDNPSDGLSLRINKIYRTYYRPVYLIFDQFEELFIFGKEEERVIFIKQIQDVLASECPCTILISIREEYLGQMYLFERLIPTFFDYRMRIEPMSGSTVRKVLAASCQHFNITVEEPPQSDSNKYDSILRNVNGEKSSIDLPYLQVYMDRFYKEDFRRTYPNGEENTEGVWLPIEFTQEEINNFGTIDDVLDKFLDEQLCHVQEQLSTVNAAVDKDLAKNILDVFVSEEGTKRPIRIAREGSLITIVPEEYTDFPSFDPVALTRCIASFENARLLRVNDDSMELAHDSLAKIIDSKRTDDERLLNDIRKLIRNSQQLFGTTGDYLTANELNLIDNYAKKLDLNTELQGFVTKSHYNRDREIRQREAKMTDDLAREKQLKDEAMRQKDIAEKEKDKAQQLAEVARKEKEKTIVEKRRAQRAVFAAIVLLTMLIPAFAWAFMMKGEAQEALEKQKTAEKDKVETAVVELIRRIAEIKKDYPKLGEGMAKDAEKMLNEYKDNKELDDLRDEITSLIYECQEKQRKK